MVTRTLLDIVTVDFSPAARETNETKTLIPLYLGDVVLTAVLIPVVKSADADTVELGDTGDTDRFIAAFTLTGGTVNTPVDGVTAVFPSPALADKTIDARYLTAGAGGATIPKTRFVVTILRCPRF